MLLIIGVHTLSDVEILSGLALLSNILKVVYWFGLDWYQIVACIVESAIEEIRFQSGAELDPQIDYIELLAS